MRRLLHAALAVFFAAAVPSLAAAQEAPSLPVRFGVHPTYERMVFDWTQPVEYRVVEKGNSVTLSFDKPARIDEPAVLAGLGRVATGVGIEGAATQLSLTMALTDGVRLRHFRAGTKVVLDFSRAATPDKPPVDKPTTEKTAAEKPVAKPAEPKPAATKATMPPPPPPAATEKMAAAAPAAPSPSTPSLSTPSMPAAAASPTAPPTVIPAAANNPPPAANPVKKPDGIAALPIAVIRTGDGFGLRFGWKEPVAAAVFGRGQHLWIAFDRPTLLDLSALQARRDDLVGDIDIIESKGTVLRLSPPVGTSTLVRREGTAWIIELGRLPRRPMVPVAVSTRAADNPSTARMFLELPGAQSLLQFRDPDIGDLLFVVPTAVEGAGVAENRSLPQFHLLPSAQGVVVRKYDDSVDVRPVGNGVEISSGRGLFMSALPDAPTRTTALGRERSRLFDFAAWRRNGPEKFTEDRQALHRAVAAAADQERNRARLDLARFLFAYGHVVDTLVLLRMIEQEDAPMVATGPARAMRAVSAFMAGDLAEATRLFDDKSLEKQPEIDLWRGALALAEGDEKTAIVLISRNSDVSESYPAPFANRLGLAIAEAWIIAGDAARASARLDIITSSQPTPGERAQLAYLRGHLARLQGEDDIAEAIWRKVASGPTSPARAAATLAWIDILIEAGKMGAREAIEELDRLRFGWRGDRYEFLTLRKLGQMQLAAGDYRSGLNTLRQAVTYFPDGKDTRPLVAEMSEAFERLYLGGAADRLSPVAAIGLFEDFRELAPSGAKGDEMTRRLADRLVAVDLLDRAADLLENLVKHRQAGAPRAATGARLALVRLLGRNPNAALEALKTSEAADLPPALARERQRLAARALADLGRPQDALARLVDDQDADADLLRADIYWRAQDWPQAAAALGRLAGDPPAGAAPAPDNQARQIIHMAVALALAGDEAGLGRLRERFGAPMDETPFKDVFRVLASERGGPVADVRQIANRVAATAPFQSFLANYRQRLAAGAKSGEQRAGS
ncbi:MAG: hypothetical protein HY057_02920 [Rhodospirillales bacterium]|nr:hypothetical protein [Rhodospirillales bacterium]